MGMRVPSSLCRLLDGHASVRAACCANQAAYRGCGWSLTVAEGLARLERCPGAELAGDGLGGAPALPEHRGVSSNGR